MISIQNLITFLVILMILALYRVFRGPTHFDRLTGLGIITTNTVVLIILLGYMQNRLDMYVDIALAYALINFIGVIAFAKFFESRISQRAK